MILNHRDNLFISVVKIYATAQLTPRAVPIAANTAEARFHRNFISLALFSFVIILSSIILIVLNLLGTEIHGFFKDTAWLRIDIFHGTSWLWLASQVHGLVTFFNIPIFQYFLLEPCLYFSIAIMQIKPFLCSAQPCLWKSRVHPCLKFINNLQFFNFSILKSPEGLSTYS